jgi:N-acetylglucosaminyl-diphospho-decaprenol L-rhamnosyltransferase
MTMPEVSVLIVNWNTCDLLRSCLASLEHAEPDGVLETIVVDNGSADGSAAMVRTEYPSAVLVENTDNAGFAAGVNQADALATAPLRLLLNSDTVVPPGAIAGCAEHLRADPEVAGVGCRLLNVDGSQQSSVFRFPSVRGLALNASYVSKIFPTHPLLNWDRYGFGDWTDIRRADVVMGSFLLLERDVVSLDEPLLDEGYFMYGEETDLCRRIVEKGQRIEFHPGYAITHLHGASSRTPGQLAWSEEAKRRGQLRFLHRWRPPAVAWTANLVLLLGLAPRWCGWAALDLIDRVRGRGSTGRRLRAGAARFHLRALTDLSALDEPWGPPPGTVA